MLLVSCNNEKKGIEVNNKCIYVLTCTFVLVSKSSAPTRQLARTFSRSEIAYVIDLLLTVWPSFGFSFSGGPAQWRVACSLMSFTVTDSDAQCALRVNSSLMAKAETPSKHPRVNCFSFIPPLLCPCNLPFMWATVASLLMCSVVNFVTVRSYDITLL